eukprot:1153297-Pelagomonas_calceolata.AAC.11
MHTHAHVHMPAGSGVHALTQHTHTHTCPQAQADTCSHNTHTHTGPARTGSCSGAACGPGGDWGGAVPGVQGRDFHASQQLADHQRGGGPAGLGHRAIQWLRLSCAPPAAVALSAYCPAHTAQQLMRRPHAGGQQRSSSTRPDGGEAALVMVQIC